VAKESDAFHASILVVGVPPAVLAAVERGNFALRLRRPLGSNTQTREDSLALIGRWFLLTMQPQSIHGFYEGWLDDDSPDWQLYEKAIVSIEEMYSGYRERLRGKY
jgi:hypothetical protein